MRRDSPFLDTARFVLNELSEYRFPITLRGMPYDCWHCHEQNLVPWLVHTRYWNVDGGKHQYNTEMITSEKALSYIQELLQAAGDTQYLPGHQTPLLEDDADDVPIARVPSLRRTIRGLPAR